VTERHDRDHPSPKRRWRDYRTRSGNRPLKRFFDNLSDADAADVIAAMREVAATGLRAARKVEGEIYEVRAGGDKQTYRILFAQEGKKVHVLLALEGISKKQQKLPRETIELAKRRLRDWRARGREAARLSNAPGSVIYYTCDCVYCISPREEHRWIKISSPR
jgi:phage-related protein